MRIPVRYPLSIFKFGATANGATGSADIGGEARSTAEGAVEEGGEEVLGLTQRLSLRRLAGWIVASISDRRAAVGDRRYSTLKG
jgi:hypothetical protein